MIVERYKLLKDEAKQKYIDLVDELVGSTDAPAESAAEAAPQAAGDIRQDPGFEVTMDGKLRIIKINKPEKKNALTTTMYHQVFNRQIDGILGYTADG